MSILILLRQATTQQTRYTHEATKIQIIHYMFHHCACCGICSDWNIDDCFADRIANKHSAECFVIKTER